MTVAPIILLCLLAYMAGGTLFVVAIIRRADQREKALMRHMAPARVRPARRHRTMA